MKIKIAKDLKVELNTLIRFEWKKFYPVLIIHERFEKTVKWILRIIAVIGILSSILTIDKWYYSFSLALLIFAVEQFLEKTIFEYTTIVTQPFPDFEVDYSQWKTNGFMIPKEKNSSELPYFGPSYIDKEYAIKFFAYLKSWNYGQNIDNENNIVVSIIIEPGEEYSTYLYANTKRKNLDKFFSQEKKRNLLSKYGKRQQQFVMQMIYWHTLPFKEGYLIKQFLDYQPSSRPFYLLPSVLSKVSGGNPEFLFDHAILKTEYKFKKRDELKISDIEFHFPPQKK